MKRRALVAMLLVLASALPVWAQQNKAPEPKAPWLGVVIACVLTVCVVIASIMSAKRGHRD